MDFEIWTDKNGTQWKVTEMPTRKIKKEIAELKLRFDTVGNRKIQKTDNQNVYMSIMAFCFEWINAFNLELERREKHETTKN